MATFTKFNSFVEAVALKKHNLGTDQLRVALCAAANAPVATNSILANLTQISYTNLSSRNLTTTSCLQVSGLLSLIVADLTLTAAGGSVATFRYVVIYNDTATNDELIGFYDVGLDITLLDTQTFLLDFDNVNGLLQLT